MTSCFVRRPPPPAVHARQLAVENSIYKTQSTCQGLLKSRLSPSARRKYLNGIGGERYLVAHRTSLPRCKLRLVSWGTCSHPFYSAAILYCVEVCGKERKFSIPRLYRSIGLSDLTYEANRPHFNNPIDPNPTDHTAAISFRGLAGEDNTNGYCIDKVRNCRYSPCRYSPPSEVVPFT